jgi:hypothetical protein
MDPITEARRVLDRDIARLLSGTAREAWRIYRDDAERRRRSEDDTREIALAPTEPAPR